MATEREFDALSSTKDIHFLNSVGWSVDILCIVSVLNCVSLFASSAALNKWGRKGQCKMQEKGLSTSAKMATKNPKLIKAECYTAGPGWCCLSNGAQQDIGSKTSHVWLYDPEYFLFNITTCIVQKGPSPYPRTSLFMLYGFYKASTRNPESK